MSQSAKMKKNAVTIQSPKCNKELDAQLLLRIILQQANIQPGDKEYRDIMRQIRFPGA
jgi:hypothetical protein